MTDISTAEPQCDASVEASVRALIEATDAAREDKDSGSERDRLFHKGCICVAARTAYSSLLDHLVWVVDSPVKNHDELLAAGEGMPELKVVSKALADADSMLGELGAVRGERYRESVWTKLSNVRKYDGSVS